MADRKKDHPSVKDPHYYERRVKRRLTKPGEPLDLFEEIEPGEKKIREPGDEETFSIPEGRHIWCTDIEIFGGTMTAKIWIDEKLYEFVLPHLVWLEKKLIHNTIYNFNQFRKYIKDRYKSYKRLK